ncbi:MAG: multidrug effflux MFS transporter [Muribaculaceae bacterium]|nr:multidrug effflux MFS transporter [Muribaculaceae bacterium]
MNTTDSNTTNSTRGFVGFVIFMAVLGAFSSLVNDMYLPTMPAMKHEFHTTTSMTQLGLTFAMIGMGIGSVFLGSLSDRYGRKPVLFASLIVFVVATAVSLLSQNITFFIICRFFQGFGAAGPMVLSTSIPADEYTGRQLAKVMALVGAINGIAPAAGPLIGGLMADFVGWRGIFVVLLVIGLAVTFKVYRMKESLPPERRATSDSLKSYWSRYRTMLSNRRFMLYVVIKSIGIALLYAYISSAPFIIQSHYGFTALQFGLIFGGNALAIAVGSALAMKFKVMKQGLVVGCVGIFVLAVAEAFIMYHSLGFILYEIAAVPMLLFSGMIFSSANTLAMEVGRSEAGTSSAILSLVKYIMAGIAAPLVGLGNLMHSSAIVFVGCAVIALVLAIPAYKLSPLQDMIKK